ncbi:MAG TPA: aminotransferase class V-fold PLP-dependent enzyme [Thermoanaerobaculia bacterium]|nr:aminotransferase class V-fold PLP-dependent enzyme [Thermoanaerobaculia bacterium]
MPVSRRAFFLTTATAAGATLLAPELLTEAKNDLADWKSVRALFQLDPAFVHAGLFYFSSHPKPVRDAIDAYRKQLDVDPLTTVETAMFGSDATHLPTRACNAIARFIGGRGEDIALTGNTTAGLALLHHGVPLKEGEEILTTEHDHAVHHDAIHLAAARSGARVRRIALFPPHDASNVDVDSLVTKIGEAITPATRVLALTWVHSSSGLRLPLREIVTAVRAKNERVLLFVDGVHGMGATTRDIVSTGIDGFASGLHKWMFGPRGTGFVWAKPEVWAQLQPLLPTFSSFELFSAWVEKRAPKGPPRANWFSPGGFHSYEHLWAIPSAFTLHETIGHERIVKRIAELNAMAKRELASMKHVRLRTPLEPSLSAGINCFEVDGIGAEEVVQRLHEAKVLAAASPYAPSYPRLSFGIANDERDVERAVEVIRTMRT